MESCRPISSASTSSNTGQFERTLIIADKGATVSYPRRGLQPTGPRSGDEQAQRPAVVDSSTPRRCRDQNSRCRLVPLQTPKARAVILQFRHQRGDCRGNNSKISWTQVETGSADHLEISEPASRRATIRCPGECLMRSRFSKRSPAVSIFRAPKMIHLGKNTTPPDHPPKGIAAVSPQNTYRRALVTRPPQGRPARLNFHPPAIRC